MHINAHPTEKNITIESIAIFATQTPSLYKVRVFPATYLRSDYIYDRLGFSRDQRHGFFLHIKGISDMLYCMSDRSGCARWRLADEALGSGSDAMAYSESES